MKARVFSIFPAFSRNLTATFDSHRAQNATIPGLTRAPAKIAGGVIPFSYGSLKRSACSKVTWLVRFISRSRRKSRATMRSGALREPGNESQHLHGLRRGLDGLAIILFCLAHCVRNTHVREEQAPARTM